MSNTRCCYFVATLFVICTECWSDFVALTTKQLYMDPMPQIANFNRPSVSKIVKLCEKPNFSLMKYNLQYC